MRQAVRDAFVSFTEGFEGKCSWLYLDVKGLVTTAIGNLVDPSAAAVGLPFRHPDGSPATREEILREWVYVKSRIDLALAGGGAFARITTLRLDDAGISQVVLGKLAQTEASLKGRFPDWEDWPADAQLGLLSMAWAAGAGIHFPKFQAAALKQDWTTCTTECHLDDTNNPGLRPRNAANVRLFQNSARVQAFGLDPSILYFPSDASVTSEAFQQPR